MPRLRLGIPVLDAAKERIACLMRDGHRVVVTFSGGKDSTVCLELAIMAAQETGYGPVEVAAQDEEIAYPGTYEFIERVAQRPEVKMHWYVMQQPMLNLFNRVEPYWWVMDPQLEPHEWVREPPPYAEFVKDNNLYFMVNPQRFPVEYAKRAAAWEPEDKRQRLVGIVGLRTAESAKRLLGLFASSGYVAGANDVGVHLARPIYDWGDGDVWKFIHEFKLDYNKAYDTLYRMGTKSRHLRVGPPTMTKAGIVALDIASRAWPAWFDRVAHRVPGIRTAVQFGERAVSPYRKYGETWEDCFNRECMGPNLPNWIRERSAIVAERVLRNHTKHSSKPLPETQDCMLCGVLGSWRKLAHVMWNGDPYGQSTDGMLDYIEPEFFRPGAGTWAGDVETGGRKVKITF